MAPGRPRSNPTLANEVAVCRHISCIDYAVVSKKVANPRTWTCDQCISNTESVWICLQCSHTGCGRTCKQKHAIKHYQKTQHPIVLHVNHKMPFCYECNDWILNDHRLGYIAMLREQISRLQNQTFEASMTRSGRLIRGPRSQFQFVEAGDDVPESAHIKPRFSAQFTARHHYHLGLMKRTVAAWKQLKYVPAGVRSVLASPWTTAPSSPVAGPGTGRRRFLGRTGLRNLGNMCYQNATLMCLSSVKSLRSILAEREEASETRFQGDRSKGIYAEAKRMPVEAPAGPVPTGQSDPTLLLQLQKLLQVIWSGKWAGVCPSFFVKTFMLSVPKFQGYMQHDAHEFFSTLLDWIGSCRRDPSAMRLAIQTCFTCHQESHTTCHTCGAVSEYRFPATTCITLNIDYTCSRLQKDVNSDAGRRPRRTLAQYEVARTCRIDDCLHDLVAPIELTGSSLYRCNSGACSGALVSALKRDSFRSLAPCVVFHINRTKWDLRGKRKVLHTLEFPLAGLDLSPIVSERGHPPLHYRLRGLVLHHGPDIDQGHYTSICYKDELNSYVAFNDLTSEVLSEEEIITGEYSGHAYLLFYERTS